MVSNHHLTKAVDDTWSADSGVLVLLNLNEHPGINGLNARTYVSEVLGMGVLFGDIFWWWYNSADGVYYYRFSCFH